MKHQPSLKIVILLACGVLLTGTGITVWARSGCEDSRSRYEQLEKEVPDENVLRKQVAESQAKVDQTKSQLQHLEEAVPGMAYVPTLLAELEKLGKDHHISVTGVRPVVEPKVNRDAADKKSGEKKKSGYEEMLIDISGRGTYADVLSMVDALKQFPKILGIVSVGMQPQKNAQVAKDAPSKVVTLETTIRVRAYLFPFKDAPEGGSSS